MKENYLCICLVYVYFLTLLPLFLQQQKKEQAPKFDNSERKEDITHVLDLKYEVCQLKSQVRDLMFVARDLKFLVLDLKTVLDLKPVVSDLKFQSP